MSLLARAQEEARQAAGLGRIEGQITELANRVDRLDNILDALQENADTMSAGSPEEVRDMIHDAFVAE